MKHDLVYAIQNKSVTCIKFFLFDFYKFILRKLRNNLGTQYREENLEKHQDVRWP